MKNTTTTTTQKAHEGTFIPFTATKGNEAAVADLLKGAADLVKKTEPLTLQWFALQGAPSEFTIVDFFQDQKGRDAHFAGQVAAALKNASGEAVEGGWDKGVVARVENSKVLSYMVRTDDKSKAALAVRIDIQAKPGQEEALAKFLSGAADLVHATEPGTLLWYAVRIDATRFAIFDVFPNEEAKSAHFAGKVAAALNAASDELVLGGWDKGVVAHIKSYQVLSGAFR
jgi:quinol monooxygenase YgiN